MVVQVLLYIGFSPKITDATKIIIEISYATNITFMVLHLTSNKVVKLREHTQSV